MWKKWGSPPSNESTYTSGFEEECERSIESRRQSQSPEISLLFKEIDPKLLEDPGEDLLGGYRQGKFEHNMPNDLDVPIHPDLAQIIAATLTGLSTFLVNDHGKPFTDDHFSRTFKQWRDKAGLPERCVPHGLRKACATYLIDKGCSADEVMAITGHRSYQEVMLYSRKRDRAKLADSAMAKYKR